MVQNLAGSLALVTCKEPLRHNMLNQLRGIIQKYFATAFANEVDSNALEHAVQMIAQENLVSHLTSNSHKPTLIVPYFSTIAFGLGVFL